MLPGCKIAPGQCPLGREGRFEARDDVTCLFGSEQVVPLEQRRPLTSQRTRVFRKHCFQRLCLSNQQLPRLMVRGGCVAQTALGILKLAFEIAELTVDLMT